MKRIVLLVLALSVASSAFAVFTESEPNNTRGTANLITRGAAPWADVGWILSLGGSGGDVDFFKIFLNARETITLITTPMETEFSQPDTMLGLFDSGGNLLASNDDANGLGSAIRYTVGSSGDYFIGVTGFPDNGFSGGHSQFGKYALTISIIPEPASMVALGSGLLGLLAIRRRRR